MNRKTKYIDNRDYTEGEKICTKCKEKKVLTDFYFDKQRNNYQSNCKKCKSKKPDDTRREWKKNYDKIPKNRIMKNLQSRCSQALKKVGLNFSIKDIGINKDDLFKWIEFQFHSDMKFENYGSLWNIDHCLPCSKFNLVIYDEYKQCFNWKNLKPCYIKSNLHKYNKVDYNLALFQDIKSYYFQKSLN